MVLPIVIFSIFSVANSAHLTKEGSHGGHDVAAGHQSNVRRNGGRQQQGNDIPNFEIIHMDISNLKPLPPFDPDLKPKRKIQENLNPGQAQPPQFAARRNGNQRRQRAQRRMQRRRQQQRRRQKARRRNRMRNARRQQATRNQVQRNQNPVINTQNHAMMQPAVNIGNQAQQQKNMIDLMKPTFPLNHMVPQPMIMNQIPNTNNMAFPNIQQVPTMQNKPVMQQGLNPLNPQGIPNLMNAAANPIANNMMLMQGNQMIQPRNAMGNPLPVGMGNGIGATRNMIASNNQIPRPPVPQVPSLNLNMNGKGQNQLNQQLNNAIQSAVKNDQAGPKTHQINLQITRKKIVPDNGPAPVHPPLLPKHMINRRPENPKHAQAKLPPLVAKPIPSLPQTVQNSALNNLISQTKPQVASGSLTSLLSSSLIKPAINPKDFTQGRLEQNLLIPASANVKPKQAAIQKVPTVSIVKTNSQLTNSPIQVAGNVQNDNGQKAISIPIDNKAPKVIHVTTSNKHNDTGPLTSMLTSNGSQIPFNVTTTKKNGKMEIMLMSKYTGNRPIVIEAAAGNILLSHVKSPNGQTQFIIKHEKPTTKASASQTTDIPTTTVTEEPGEFEAEDYPTTTVSTTVANAGSASKA